MNEIPLTTIPELLRFAAQEYADGEAINDGDTVFSFEELGQKVKQTTRAMMAAGVESGDRVAIWAPNVWEWVVAALGIHCAGGVLVPINTRFKGVEALYVLQKSRARLLLTVEGFLGNDYVRMLRESAGGVGDASPVADLPNLEQVVILRGEIPAHTSAWADFNRRGDSVSFEDAVARTDSVGPEDLSDILFTSGTTGEPKGVMTTHAQNLRAFHAWSEVVGLREGDRYLIVNPFFHAFGYKAGWLSCVMRGATIFPHPVFDVPAVMQRVSEEKITVLPGPPALFQTILAHPSLAECDMSHLRLCVTGGAVIVGDFGGGSMYCAMGILAALFERERSGKGQVVDAAIVDGVTSLMSFFYGQPHSALRTVDRGAGLLGGAAHFYRCYTCKDGKEISVGAIEPQFYAELLQRADAPEHLREAQMNPANWDNYAEDLAALFVTKTQDEWCELLEGTDACFSPVVPLDHAKDHPHMKARGAFVEHGGRWHTAPAPRFDRTPNTIRDSASDGEEVVARWRQES